MATGQSEPPSARLERKVRENYRPLKKPLYRQNAAEFRRHLSNTSCRG